MTCRKEIKVTIDWVNVVRVVKMNKDKPQGIIAIRLKELEDRFIKVG